MGDFHFLRPWWLVVLPALSVVLLYIWRIARHQGSWQEICEPHLLSHLWVTEGSRTVPLGFISLVCASVLTVVALSGPTWSHWPTPVFRHSNARVIILDVSSAMNTADVLPSRLTRAKYKVLDLLAHIHEGQTAMLVFSKVPFIVSPLTPDSRTIAAMVPVLNSTIVPVQGSDIGAALKKAGQLLSQGGAIKGSIVLITDSLPTKHALTIAATLKHKGYRTFVLGVGTTKGAPVPLPTGGFKQNKKGAIIFSPLPVGALQQLATAGGSDYIAFRDNNTDTQQLLTLTDENHLHSQLKQTLQTKILWKDEGHWFIWAALLLGLLAFRRGWWELLSS